MTDIDTPETRHERTCAYVVSDGPAPCTCKAGQAMTTPSTDMVADTVRDVISAVLAHTRVGNRVADDEPALRCDLTGAQAAVSKVLEAAASIAQRRVEELEKALRGMLRVADFGAEDSEEYSIARAALNSKGTEDG